MVSLKKEWPELSKMDKEQFVRNLAIAAQSAKKVDNNLRLLLYMASSELDKAWKKIEELELSLTEQGS